MNVYIPFNPLAESLVKGRTIKQVTGMLYLQLFNAIFHTKNNNYNVLE